MKQRLRPVAADLPALYPELHDHRLYGRGHVERVGAMIALAEDLNHFPGLRHIKSAADLSCGNGAVLDALEGSLGCQTVRGDIAPGWPIKGPIELTLDLLGPVNLFVLGETLEHLDEPDVVLRGIRKKAERLVLSTPIDAWDDANVEHLWAWDAAEVTALLASENWRMVRYTEVDSTVYYEAYRYGVWACV